MNSVFDLNNIVKNIGELCMRKGISVNRMLKDCGLSKSVIDNLKKGFDPQLGKMVIIADYFDVTVDYIVNNNSPLGTERN